MRRNNSSELLEAATQKVLQQCCAESGERGAKLGFHVFVTISTPCTTSRVHGVVLAYYNMCECNSREFTTKHIGNHQTAVIDFGM